MHSIIGKTVTDRITGFSGVAIGRVEYITGCNQLLVQPKAQEGNFKMPDSAWIDEQRVDVNDTVETVSLQNGSTPGADKAAPKI